MHTARIRNSTTKGRKYSRQISLRVLLMCMLYSPNAFICTTLPMRFYISLAMFCYDIVCRKKQLKFARPECSDAVMRASSARWFLCAARPQLRCLHSRRDLNPAVNQSSAGLYGDTFKGQPVCMEKLNGLVGFTGRSCYRYK